MDSLTLEKDTLKIQDHIGNKCSLVCFNMLSSVILDTKKQQQSTTTTKYLEYCFSHVNFRKQFMSCMTLNFLLKNNAMEFVNFQLQTET